MHLTISVRTLSSSRQDQDVKFIYVYFDEDNTIDAEEYYNVCWKEKRAESKDDDDFSSKLADCIFDCVIKDIGISHTDMRPVQYRH